MIRKKAMSFVLTIVFVLGLTVPAFGIEKQEPLFTEKTFDIEIVTSDQVEAVPVDNYQLEPYSGGVITALKAVRENSNSTNVSIIFSCNGSLSSAYRFRELYMTNTSEMNPLVYADLSSHAGYYKTYKYAASTTVEMVLKDRIKVPLDVKIVRFQTKGAQVFLNKDAVWVSLAPINEACRVIVPSGG